MKLREYQAKQIFAQYGIQVPEGGIARSPEDAARIATELGSAVVIKPQLGVKGRGKVGGIRFAEDPAGAAEEARDLLGATIKGELVETVLVEKRIAFEEELYIAVTVDHAARQPVLIASLEGGVDIEEVARNRPERVLRHAVDILDGPTIEDLQTFSENVGKGVAKHLATVYRIFRDYDAEIVEINPLVLTAGDELVAVDAVLNVNEDSVARHEDLAEFAAEIPVADPIALEAAQESWTYIEMDGDIGVLSSGAGLTMAILDLIHAAGGHPGNFLDTAQFDEGGIRRAFDLLSRAKPFRALLVNIFAGLNRCDSLARGIAGYLADHEFPVPVVVRMIGNQEEEGHAILRSVGIDPHSELEGAVAAVVRLAEGGEG